MTPILIGSPCCAEAGATRKTAVTSASTDESRIMGHSSRAQHCAPTRQGCGLLARRPSNGPHITFPADQVNRQLENELTARAGAGNVRAQPTMTITAREFDFQAARRRLEAKDKSGGDKLIS